MLTSTHWNATFTSGHSAKGDDASLYNPLCPCLQGLTISRPFQRCYILSATVRTVQCIAHISSAAAELSCRHGIANPEALTVLVLSHPTVTILYPLFSSSSSIKCCCLHETIKFVFYLDLWYTATTVIFVFCYVFRDAIVSRHVFCF